MQNVDRFVDNIATRVTSEVAKVLQGAVTKDAQFVAQQNPPTLKSIEGLVDLSAALVADKVAMSFLHTDGSTPISAANGDPTININILGQSITYTFLPNVSGHDILDVGAVVGGSVLAAVAASSGAAVGAAAVPLVAVAGGLIALYGAYDLLNRHVGDITGLIVNGQNPTSPENTALPPVALDNGEIEPDGDSDDASFVGSALASTTTNIPGLSNYLQSTFPSFHLS